MPALHTQLRNRLEAAVKQARRTAEAAAKVVLERLTVGSAEPGAHLNVDERQLRNRLRAHGRQLGDGRDPKTGAQSINRLVHECAYEHWHRMLFARFLAENQLLIHEKEGMPVTLAECEELAADEGAPDGWTLAARYAARMLPQIFRPDDPVLQIRFAPENKRALEKLVTDLSVEVFTASDSLGWCYQFWQAERKEEVNKARNKIGADELPSVTQLFTEDYMVDFLLDNTLGAWQAGKILAANPNLAINAKNEDELREAVTLPGCSWKYLRFIKGQDGVWIPAAGTFNGWPKTTKELKCLDPCMGSGHFVVAMFERLVVLRMAQEKLDEAVAVAAVIRDNLFGLEIDLRCTQISAFNLALAAWRRVGHRALPAMNLACSGLAPNTREADWLAIAGDNQKLQRGMERLYRLFQKAAVLGSLINPRASESDLLVAAFHELRPLLEKALAHEAKDDTAREMAVTARGLVKAAEILAGQFTLVATNVPYLGRGKQDEVLMDYCEHVHTSAKADLATCFVERCLDFASIGGSTALITPQNWLFLGTYKKLREKFLENVEWNCVALLGEGGFASPQAAGAFTAMLTHTHRSPGWQHRFSGVDVSDDGSPTQKAEALLRKEFRSVEQATQTKNPDARIVFEVIAGARLLRDYAKGFAGVLNGDSLRFLGFFWEQRSLSHGWECLQSTVEDTVCYGGREAVIFWQKGNGDLRRLAEALRERLHDADTRGNEAWGKLGIAVSSMRSMPVTLYTGQLFDSNAAVILPHKQKDLAAIWTFCSSPDFHEAVRRIDRATKVTNATLVKIPFDLTHWQKVAAKKYPHGLPKAYSSGPTQWLFNGQPKDSDHPMHVAAARLLGYQWPRQTGSSFPDCPGLGPDGLEKLADDDGIVCIPSVRGEAPAAERLRALLAAAYGKEWSPAKLDELLGAVGFAGSNLDDWLRNGFFEQHCKLFHHRPFIWQVWDGRKDGFSALVNNHKLDHKLLEKLTYTALGDWIKKQQDAVANEESGADDRLVKARQLQDKLKLILEGEAPYDIFVRWKPLEQQPIGWHPDLNDGVRLNIRPFMEADVLRKRPNIKWGIDRGKNPPGSPWGEERDNDRHLTLEEKRKARGENSQHGREPVL